MDGHSLLATLSALALLLLLIVRWKLHPFIALLASALALGLISGMSSQTILASLQKGMADLLGSRPDYRCRSERIIHYR